MRILTTGDLDPMGSNIEQFYEKLKNEEEPDLILFAGDMYQWRQFRRYQQIGEFIDKLGWKCPIVAIPGNREFDEDLALVKKNAGDRIKFLDDDSVVLDIDGKKVGIVGSRGVLDHPTMWQLGNVMGIQDMYKDRLDDLAKQLVNLECDIKILLTHYSPTFKTLEGENKMIFSGLGSQRLEQVLVKTGVTFAIHGHAHYGIPLAFVEKVPVYNVAYPVNNGLVIIDTEKLPKTEVFRV
ncbi:MAG: hypothetical protein GOV02_02030 [Candidatus Aenigmarchaeota archaeon]|nr:hypothetical protein [Candidatus Aenigmarchaeota archaeon]